MIGVLLAVAFMLLLGTGAAIVCDIGDRHDALEAERQRRAAMRRAVMAARREEVGR